MNKIEELQNLNIQFIKNILGLQYQKGNLEFLCIFEFIIILLLGLILIL